MMSEQIPTPEDLREMHEQYLAGELDPDWMPQLFNLIHAWAGRAAQMSWIKQVGTVQIRRINEDAGHDHKPNLLVFDLAPYAPREPKSD